MKLTTEQTNKLRELAFAGVNNKNIAAQLGIPITEVYAYRSRNGITREKVALAKGKAPTQQTCGAAPRKPTVDPEFEAAVQQMVAEGKVRCADCAHWSCYAKGSANVMPRCSSFITAEARRKDYLYDRKQEFLNSIGRYALGLAVEAQTYTRIQELLDELIPDDWRHPHG